MLGWLRKLFGGGPRGATSLVDIARAADSEKTARVLAKKPIVKPTHVLAEMMVRAQPLMPGRPKPKATPVPDAIALVGIMQAEATMQDRVRSKPRPDTSKQILAEMLRAVPETAPRSAPKPRDPKSLAQVNVAVEAAQSRRLRQPSVAPAVLPLEAWSKAQQEAATRGKPPPTAPDTKKLHAALTKEDAILRALATKSAAKEAASRPAMPEPEKKRK